MTNRKYKYMYLIINNMIEKLRNGKTAIKEFGEEYKIIYYHSKKNNFHLRYEDFQKDTVIRDDKIKEDDVETLLNKEEYTIIDSK